MRGQGNNFVLNAVITQPIFLDRDNRNNLLFYHLSARVYRKKFAMVRDLCAEEGQQRLSSTHFKIFLAREKESSIW
jgi:hypothetical protein